MLRVLAQTIQTPARLRWRVAPFPAVSAIFSRDHSNRRKKDVAPPKFLNDGDTERIDKAKLERLREWYKNKDAVADAHLHKTIQRFEEDFKRATTDAEKFHQHVEANEKEFASKLQAIQRSRRVASGVPENQPAHPSSASSSSPSPASEDGDAVFPPRNINLLSPVDEEKLGIALKKSDLPPGPMFKIDQHMFEKLNPYESPAPLRLSRKKMICPLCLPNAPKISYKVTSLHITALTCERMWSCCRGLLATWDAFSADSKQACVLSSSDSFHEPSNCHATLALCHTQASIHHTSSM